MIRMRKSKFKKHIDQLEEDDLRDELLGLYDKLEEVRHYYQMELGSQEEREKRYVKARKEIEAKYKTKGLLCILLIIHRTILAYSLQVTMQLGYITTQYQNIFAALRVFLMHEI